MAVDARRIARVARETASAVATFSPLPPWALRWNDRMRPSVRSGSQPAIECDGWPIRFVPVADMCRSVLRAYSAEHGGLHGRLPPLLRTRCRHVRYRICRYYLGRSRWRRDGRFVGDRRGGSGAVRRVACHVAKPGRGNQQNENHQKLAHRLPPFKATWVLPIYLEVSRE
jgi:hypothetical protein